MWGGGYGVLTDISDWGEGGGHNILTDIHLCFQTAAV